MPAYTDNYANRLGIGFLIALCVHAVLFVLLQFVFQIRLFEKPEYPESIYISLENTSTSTVETRTDAKDTTRNVVETKTETKVTDTEKKSNTNTQVSKSGTVTEQKKSTTTTDSSAVKKTTTTTDTSAVKKTTDTAAKNTSSDNTAGDSVPVKGTDVSGSTTGKSALDDLSSLDKAIASGSDSGTSGSSSTGNSGTATGKQGSATAGGSVGTTIEWEDSATRAARTVVQPKIPAWVQKQGLRLQTTLSFVLTSEGLLLNVLVIKKSGYTEVDNAFRDALRGYRFEPREGARNIKGTITFVIDYR